MLLELSLMRLAHFGVRAGQIKVPDCRRSFDNKGSLIKRIETSSRRKESNEIREIREKSHLRWEVGMILQKTSRHVTHEQHQPDAR